MGRYVVTFEVDAEEMAEVRDVFHDVRVAVENQRPDVVIVAGPSIVTLRPERLAYSRP